MLFPLNFLWYMTLFFGQNFLWSSVTILLMVWASVTTRALVSWGKRSHFQVKREGKFIIQFTSKREKHNFAVWLLSITKMKRSPTWESGSGIILSPYQSFLHSYCKLVKGNIVSSLLRWNWKYISPRGRGWRRRQLVNTWQC